MNLTAFLRPGARQALAAAASWHEDRREALGSEFIDAFLLCVDRIEDSPESYPLVDAEVRRALLHRFPYAIYYSVKPTQPSPEYLALPSASGGLAVTHLANAGMSR